MGITDLRCCCRERFMRTTTEVQTAYNAGPFHHRDLPGHLFHWIVKRRFPPRPRRSGPPLASIVGPSMKKTTEERDTDMGCTGKCMTNIHDASHCREGQGTPDYMPIKKKVVSLETAHRFHWGTIHRCENA